MFHDIPMAMRRRMQHLEALDTEQRRLRLPTIDRLCAVPPDTGRFLALMAAAAPRGSCLELGTSGGYSALWLSLACRLRGDKLTTFEIHPAKIEVARETFCEAAVESLIDLVVGDARRQLLRHRDIAFCFLDIGHDDYIECYEAVMANTVPGGLIVADNVIDHRQECEPYIRHALADPRVDAVIVPIGKGELLCRRR
jgi:caffeoyl-CoA O-methyltransferase